MGKAVEGRVQLYLYISGAFSLYCTFYYFGAIRLTFLATTFEILASFKRRLFSHSQVHGISAANTLNVTTTILNLIKTS